MSSRWANFVRKVDTPWTELEQEHPHLAELITALEEEVEALHPGPLDEVLRQTVRLADRRDALADALLTRFRDLEALLSLDTHGR